ncbi:hypothetical protein ACFC5X_12060 [Streptomyces sp. NPDC055952]|uniref:hypothetical protein n=1 Tax=Streptomyces sp. NPDC055952 TaxID=3345663 RepID=UPI0035E00380
MPSLPHTPTTLTPSAPGPPPTTVAPADPVPSSMRVDRPGDPHSPYRYGTRLRGQLRGVLSVHVGRLFRNDRTPPERYAPDLLADPAIRAVARAFPALYLPTPALPFALGRAIGGSRLCGVTALLWAGIVLLHHVTWSVNSLCHLIGARPSTPVIRLLEPAGWVHDVRWPSAERVAARRL